VRPEAGGLRRPLRWVAPGLPAPPRPPRPAPPPAPPPPSPWLATAGPGRSLAPSARCTPLHPAPAPAPPPPCPTTTPSLPLPAYIKLELPVFHIGYFKNTVQVLQCICKSCSRVLMPERERLQWARRFRNPRAERVSKEGMFKRVIDRCKRVRLCPHCGDYNGVVKWVAAGGVRGVVQCRVLGRGGGAGCSGPAAGGACVQRLERRAAWARLR
jgi:hypothetical protein